MNTFNRFINNMKNLFIIPQNMKPKDFGNYENGKSQTFVGRTDAGGSTSLEHNVSNSLVPIQLPRVRQDIGNWRKAVEEAENAYFPYRVLMQQIFIDLKLDPHILACVTKRKNLTLLREFEAYDINTDIADEKWTNYFKKSWIEKLISYVLDAKTHGYSLISLGDIIDDNFPEIAIMRRWNISPDREDFTSITYNPDGIKFKEEPYAQWHIWVTTESEDGVSPCGYGLFYPLALPYIIMRNNLNHNTDFNELFVTPARVLKTPRANSIERAQAENDLRNMGSTWWTVLGIEDNLEFIEGGKGQGWKSFADLEIRMHKLISKVLLGHADAMDSTPGKLGSQQGKEGTIGSPQEKSLSEIQTTDGYFVEKIINEELITRMRYHGISIPVNIKFRFKNSDETEEIEKRKNELNLTIAQISYQMMQGGLHMDPNYFTNVTGIETILPQINENKIKNNLEQNENK